jgi:hypothetical protein
VGFAASSFLSAGFSDFLDLKRPLSLAFKSLSAFGAVCQQQSVSLHTGHMQLHCSVELMDQKQAGDLPIVGRVLLVMGCLAVKWN